MESWSGIGAGGESAHCAGVGRENQCRERDRNGFQFFALVAGKDDARGSTYATGGDDTGT